MFLQYATPGALLPLYTLHLTRLGMGPLLTGVCCATQSLATVLVALLVGQAADRWFSAERCLAVCAFLSGLTLWLLASATGFWPIFLLTLLFWLLVNPVIQLGATICFIHLSHPEREFGPIRMWGTVGWAVPGWLLLLFALCFGAIGVDAAPGTNLFRLGGFFGVALGLYALTIPHTPPRRSADRRPAPLAALALLRSPAFTVCCLCTFGLCVTYPFTTQATPLLLKSLNVPGLWLGPILTLAQATEILSLALLPMLLMRLGVRGTMVMGLIAWTLAMSILTIGRPVGLVIGSLALNGLFVTGFLVTGQVFVNKQASGDLRASAQALLTFVNGFGNLIGHLLIGWLRWIYGNDSNLPRAFAVALVIAGCLLLVFLLGFQDRRSRPEKEPADDRSVVVAKITGPRPRPAATRPA